MKSLFILTIFAASLLAADEPKKPSDAAIAAYFKADSAISATRSNHDKLLENIKKALGESVTAQLSAMQAATDALNKLASECGDQKLDLQALQQAGEVKCIAAK